MRNIKDVLSKEEIKEEKGLLWRILDVVNEFLPEKEHRRIYTELIDIVDDYADLRLDYDTVMKSHDEKWPLLAQICYEGSRDYYAHDSLIYILSKHGPLSKKDFISRAVEYLKVTEEFASTLIEYLDNNDWISLEEGKYTSNGI